MEQLFAGVLGNSSSYDFERYQHWSVLSVDFLHVFMSQHGQFEVSKHYKTVLYLPVYYYHVTYTSRANLHSAITQMLRNTLLETDAISKI